MIYRQGGTWDELKTGVELRNLGSQAQLAARWQVAEASLERWRSTGIGPKFLKLPGKVRYRLDDVEAFEEACLKNATKALKSQAG